MTHFTQHVTIGKESKAPLPRRRRVGHKVSKERETCPPALPDAMKRCKRQSSDAGMEIWALGSPRSKTMPVVGAAGASR